MWSTALARTHRRPPRRRSLHGASWTRTLENWLASLRHSSTSRRSRRGRWPWRCGSLWRRSVYRTRPRLRNDQAALRPANGLTRTYRRRRGTRRNLIRRHHRSRTHRGRRDASRSWRNRRRSCCHRCWRRCCLHGLADFGCRCRRNCRFCCGDLVFNHRLRRLGRWRRLYRSSWRRWLRRNEDRSRRTGYGLRRNESRSRFRLSRSSGRSGTGSRRRRRRRLGRSYHRRSHCLARRLGCDRSGRNMRSLLLLLRDRLQYIAGFRDVRQVDLRLELVHRRTAARATR
jgi:hypothetical protein